MPLWPRRQTVDRTARDHAAGVISALLEGGIDWKAVPGALGHYAGPDRGVEVVHRELRAIGVEPGEGRAAPGDDPELNDVLRRTRWFLRSGEAYRWSDRGPVEIVGAYLGVAALAWMVVGGAGALWGFDNEAVIAGALLAMLLMYVMATAMGVALLRRLWWRYTAKREGADHAVWPFFTPAEYRAARELAPDAPA